ncbi:MAG: hypothetical protein WDO24_11485 [Pseudomonadota bacterium]
MAADRTPWARRLVPLGVVIVVAGVGLVAYYGGVFGSGKEAAVPTAAQPAASTAQARTASSS